MRKYFLISTVALLATSSANAENYTNLEILANVEMATKIDCSALNFGNIVVMSPSNNFTATVTLKTVSDSSGTGNMIAEKSEQIISVDNFSLASCQLQTNKIDFPNSVTLTNENGKTMTVTDFSSHSNGPGFPTLIGATLNIAGNTGEDISGSYTGSVTLVGFSEPSYQ